MTALQLYKYITDNNIEWHYRFNDETQQEDVVMFPYIRQVEDFYKLLSNTIFDDDGIECIMKDGYFAFWLNDICEYYGIELSEVFDKEKEY